MATSYTWTGATSDALTTTTNYTPNGTPGNTDSIYFPKDVTNAPATSMNGLADTLALVHVAAGATYDIGSSGNELQVKCTKVVHLGRGALWYATDGNTADSNIILAPGAGGSSNILVNASTTEVQLYCLAGVVSVTGTGTTLDLVVVGRTADREASVTLASGLATATVLQQYAGICVSSNVITTLQLSGGRHEKIGTQEAVTVRQTGGAMIYDATDTVTRYEALHGTVDFTRSGKAMTVTTFVESPTMRVILSPDLTTFTTHLQVSEAL